MRSPRQANVSKRRIRGRELRIPVRRQIDAREALVVQRVREWQRDGDYRIIPMIAGVRRAGHNAGLYLTDHVLVAGRAGRGRSC